MAIMAVLYEEGLDLQDFDAAYLERLRDGDPDTERHFISYFGELILIKLGARIRSRQLIEDVRQETFLRVFRALRSPGAIRFPERLGAFVNSVCNNVLMEFLRAEQRHPHLPGEEVPFPDPHALDPEYELISEERKAGVRLVIDSLPARDRQVLQALFLEEKEKDDVCEELGVGRDYLRVLLHRAKAQFRAVFEERHGEAQQKAPLAFGARRPPRST